MILRPPSVAATDLPNRQALRHFVDKVRRHTSDHLDFYLEQLAEAVAPRGGRVHFAVDATAARSALETVLGKTPSVVIQDESLADQIDLRRSLKRMGFAPVEGDHGLLVIFPGLAIAETGQVCLIGESSPPAGGGAVLAIVKTDRLVPRLADLAVLLKLANPAPSGRAMPADTRLISADDLIIVDTQALEPMAGRLAKLRRRLRRTPQPPPTAAEDVAVFSAASTPHRRWQRWGVRA